MLEALTLEMLITTERGGAPTPNTDYAPIWLRQAREFLHDSFLKSLSLEEIAIAAGEHSSHLARSFRLYYHYSPGEYVRQLRMEYACRLLITSQTPLAQIAREAGFSDQSHFCRVFKRMTGMTPAEYQKTLSHASPSRKRIA